MIKSFLSYSKRLKMLVPFMEDINDEWFSDDLNRIDDENVYRERQVH